MFIVPILLGIGIIVSLGREVLFAKYFGTGREIEIFRLAFSVPNMFSQSLAPAVIAAIVPMLIVADKKGPQYGYYFIKQMFAANLYLALFIAIGGIVSAPLQAILLAPGFDGIARDYLTSQIAIMWIFFFIMYLTFGFRAVLYNHGIFWQGTSSNLIVSLVFFCGVEFIHIFGGKHFNSSSLSTMAIFASLFVLCVHLLQNLDELKLKNILKANAKYAYFGTYSIISSIISVTIFKVSNTIPRFIDRAIATEFPQGVVASLEYSYSFLNVPGILLSSGFATVFYPTFVAQIKQKNFSLSKIQFEIYIFTAVVLFSLLIGLVIHIYAEEIISVIFQRGAFNASSVTTTSVILKWQGLGLTGLIGGIILSQAILGFGVIKLLIVVALIKIIIKYILLIYLVEKYGIAGLGGSFAITESLMFIFLLFVFILQYIKVKNQTVGRLN